MEAYAPGMDYWVINTGESMGGGLMKRQTPEHRITDYFDVASLLESSAKVEKLGGKLLIPKMAVPGMGYFSLCMDTEGNVFGLWEADPQAK